MVLPVPLVHKSVLAYTAVVGKHTAVVSKPAVVFLAGCCQPFPVSQLRAVVLPMWLLSALIS